MCLAAPLLAKYVFCDLLVCEKCSELPSKVERRDLYEGTKVLGKPPNFVRAKTEYFRGCGRHPAMQFGQVRTTACDAHRGGPRRRAGSQNKFHSSESQLKVFGNKFGRTPADGHLKSVDVKIHASYPPRNPPLARDSCAGKVLFVDAFTAGIAGDMFVAALVDLGVPFDLIITQLARLDLEGDYSLNIVTTSRSEISAPLFFIEERMQKPLVPRSFKDVKTLLEGSVLTPGSKQRALKTFTLLAEAESSAHGVSVETVYFHEVGALDSIVDIVAVAVCLDYLGVNEVIVSPLPIGRGLISGAAHGALPCPAPATVQCLCAADLSTYATYTDGEFVTPTGASLLATLKTGIGDWPRRFVQERTGYGAGIKKWRHRPNLLRIVLGTVEET